MGKLFKITNVIYKGKDITESGHAEIMTNRSYNNNFFEGKVHEYAVFMSPRWMNFWPWLSRYYYKKVVVPRTNKYEEYLKDKYYI